MTDTTTSQQPVIWIISYRDRSGVNLITFRATEKPLEAFSDGRTELRCEPLYKQFRASASINEAVQMAEDELNDRYS